MFIFLNFYNQILAENYNFEFDLHFKSKFIIKTMILGFLLWKNQENHKSSLFMPECQLKRFIPIRP